MAPSPGLPQKGRSWRRQGRESVVKYSRSPGLRVISRAAGILLSRTGPMRSIRCSRGGERAMPKGTVKKIVSDRGFGFIAADDGKEYFFHQSGVYTPPHFSSPGPVGVR